MKTNLPITACKQNCLAAGAREGNIAYTQTVISKKTKNMKQKIIILLTIYLLFNSALSAQNIEKMNKSELREHFVILTTKIDSLKNENINLQESISKLYTNSSLLEEKNKTNEVEISRINELILKNENERKRIISENKIGISKLNEIIITLKDSISSFQSSSNVDSTSTTFNSFAFIADNEYIIISDTPDTNWAKGIPRIQEATRDGVYSAITDVKIESLPSVYSSLLHKQFKVCGNDHIFSAKIKSFKLLSEFIPHFGQVQEWDGTYETDGTPLTSEQIALDIWKSASLYLVAEFDIDSQEKNIGNLYFAVPSDKPTPILFSFLSDSSENTNIRDRVSQISYKTTDYENIQKDYLSKLDISHGKWWNNENSSESFSFFEVKNGEGYAILNHVSGSPCDIDFYEAKFSIWKLKNKTQILLLNMTDGYYSTILATDIDGDNIPEFLIEDGFGYCSLLKKVGEEWIDYYSWKIPYHDCPC